MTSMITEVDEPTRFVDEQVRGPFRRFRHEHCFDAPPGPLDRVAEVVVVTLVALGRHLPTLIEQRNAYLKARAETAP